MDHVTIGLIVGSTWTVVGALGALAFGALARVGSKMDAPPVDHERLDATARGLLVARHDLPKVTETPLDLVSRDLAVINSIIIRLRNRVRMPEPSVVKVR
jgi:hypothetical protein